MQVYQVKTKKLSGTDFHEVYKKAFGAYQQNNPCLDHLDDRVLQVANIYHKHISFLAKGITCINAITALLIC